MNAHDLAAAMISAKTDLDQALIDHRQAVLDWTQADQVMRIAKATAFLASSGTVGERNAYMDKATAGEQAKAEMLKGWAVNALEAIRSRRQVLSALQSLAAAQRAEAELARYEPRELAP